MKDLSQKQILVHHFGSFALSPGSSNFPGKLLLGNFDQTSNRSNGI
jgi:hypothetical protein